MNIQKSKVKEFISRGTEIKQKEYHVSGMVPPYISGPLYDQWMSEIEIFADKYLKTHSLRNAIHTAFFHRNNNFSSYSNMMGYLNLSLQTRAFLARLILVKSKKVIGCLG